MTLPPGKLLLLAAVLLGAALAQAAKPSSAPAGDPPTATKPITRPTAKQKLLSVKPRQATTPPKHRSQRNQPVQWPQHSVSKPIGSKPIGPNLATGGKVLYLTFDDGPQREWTPQVLSVLTRHHAQATFFVLGREAAAHPELIATARSLGHTIGNHTWDHPRLTRLSPERIRQEISTGVPSRCFRPPYRDTNPAVAAVAASFRQRQVLWDVDTSDWEKPGAAKIERAIVRGARPGAIVLLHDGGGNRSQTVAALDRALTTLTRQGYTYRALPC
jgi:peptidoglycan/xylan/chitin deacetylase (PgdA/CDA1 family)